MKATINVTTSEDNIDKLHAFVEKYLPPKDHEKKAYGEVFTPLKLVNEMLTAIETYGDKNIWTNPNLKILDPAAGIGNFPLIAYQKLMKGLANTKGLKDPEKRRRHILENMLYMVELNPVNSRLMEKIFSGKKYKLNILTTSFLLESEKDINNDPTLTKKQKQDGKRLLQWKKDIKFDIIMGNPPYQPQSDGKKGGKSLWPEFVKQSMDILDKNRYLVFVHPSIWRKPGYELRTILFNNQLLRLVLNEDNTGKDVFQAATRYDWYVLQKHAPKKMTEVTFVDGSTYILMIDQTLPFIPNFGWPIFQKVLAHLRKGLQAKNDSACHTQLKTTSSEQKPGFDYPCVNSISEKNGLVLAYSSKPHPHQNDKKVIFSNGRYIVPIFDDGKYGTTQGGIYILVNSNKQGIHLASYLQCKLIKYLVKATKWSNFETNKQLFTYIQDPSTMLHVSDDAIYDYYGFSPVEIDMIVKA